MSNSETNTNIQIPRTAQEVITVLQQQGYQESFEKNDGSIEIKRVTNLDCKLIQNPDHTWKPIVSVSLMNIYAVVIAIFTHIVLLVFFGSQTYIIIIAILIGSAASSFILKDRAKSTTQQIEDVLRA
jgi:hypothetical protein